MATHWEHLKHCDGAGYFCVFVSALCDVCTLHENKLNLIVYTVVEGQCDNRWDEFQGSCYYISTGTDSWYGARSWCMENGGDLTSILTEEEQDHVHLMVIIIITTT